MDEALSNWLRSREAADAAARSTDLTALVVGSLAGYTPLRVLDLATGAGSNLRYLIPRLATEQEWLVVDRSPRLLTDVQLRTSQWAVESGYSAEPTSRGCDLKGSGLRCRIETHQLDLGTLPDEIFAGRHLVTASALLDLVSVAWLETLAARCRAVKATALFTLTYDGRSSSTPVEPEDELVRDLLNRHQTRDKGLGGPAAGPEAAVSAIHAFEEAGYTVASARSDWALGPAEHEMQRQLIEGWAEAALEMPGVDAGQIRDWLTRRLAQLAAGRSHITVGHVDIAAVPRSATL